MYKWINKRFDLVFGVYVRAMVNEELQRLLHSCAVLSAIAEILRSKEFRYVENGTLRAS